MKGWLGRLSLRYKLTLAALTVEALMLAFLIANGVHLTRQELQQQAEQRVREVGKTLVAALLAPLSQQDDASVRDIVDTLRRDDGLKMIEVRDSSNRIVHQAGSGGDATDFFLKQPVEYSGQRYGEIALVLSGDFIRQARTPLFAAKPDHCRSHPAADRHPAGPVDRQGGAPLRSADPCQQTHGAGRSATSN